MMFRNSPRSEKTFKKESQRITRASAMPLATTSRPLPRIHETLYGRVHLFLVHVALKMSRKQSTSTLVWNQLRKIQDLKLNLHNQMKMIKVATRIKNLQSRNHSKINSVTTQSSPWCNSLEKASKKSVTANSLSLKFLWKDNARMQSVMNCSTDWWTTNRM